MSKVAGRSAFGRSRRADYNTKKVLILRCSSCESIHDKAKFLKWGAICLMIAAGIGIACITMECEAPVWLCWVAPITGIIVVAFIGAYLQQKYGSSLDVKDLSKKAEYPPIAALMEDGWIEGTPQA